MLCLLVAPPHLGGNHQPCPTSHWTNEVLGWAFVDQWSGCTISTTTHGSFTYLSDADSGSHCEMWFGEWGHKIQRKKRKRNENIILAINSFNHVNHKTRNRGLLKVSNHDELVSFFIVILHNSLNYTVMPSSDCLDVFVTFLCSFVTNSTNKEFHSNSTRENVTLLFFK